MSCKDSLARDGAADAESKTVWTYDGGPETTLIDFRSIFSITLSDGVDLLYVLTVIARIETLGCRERKSSTRRGGASSLIWKDRNLGKLVMLNSVSHTKPVEVVSRERSVSCSRSCDVPNRSGWKGV